MVLLKNKLKKISYAQIIRYLKSCTPLALKAKSEKKAIAAYNHARNHLPYYRAHLQKINVANIEITNIQRFKKHVPVLDKHAVYHELVPSVKHLNVKQSSRILLSSGSLGNFSFGVHSRDQIKQSAPFINILFQNYFQILDKKTLIINCLTSAVHLPPLDATIAETGPRTDALLYLLKTLSPQFDQTIILGDNYFIKNSLEEGLEQGIKYSHLEIHLILGGVGLPENLRTHLITLLNRNQPALTFPLILSSMGISEFGVNLFFESAETIRLRQLVKATPALREKLLGVEENPDNAPMFFNYFPQSFYVEDIEGELVVTNLDLQAPFPLIRYKTKDHVKIIPYEDVKRICAHEKEPERLLPTFKSPLILMYGKQEHVKIQGRKIFPQQIQKGLYEDFDSTLKTTGYFRLNKNNDNITLEIQLKKGIEPSEALTRQFQQAALKYVRIDIPVVLYRYETFPHSLELDYERKFKYI